MTITIARRDMERFKWTRDEFTSLDAVQSEHIYENDNRMMGVIRYLLNRRGYLPIKLNDSGSL